MLRRGRGEEEVDGNGGRKRGGLIRIRGRKGRVRRNIKGRREEREGGR